MRPRGWGEIAYAQTDVRQREDLTSLVNLACDRHGQLDVLEFTGNRGVTFADCSICLPIVNALPMNPNKALWEKGDFTRIAATMRESGETLVRKIGVERGQKVLDLGCGDGTTALPAAKLGADVLGVDVARNLVEAGRKRAADEGLSN